MIKIEELRVGNWVNFGNKPFQVHHLEKLEENFWDDQINDFHHDNFYPIPLTEEILLKCGGKEVESNWYDYGKFEYDLETSKLWIFGSDEAITHIKYLHQLQNLYYALTGEELEVEL